MLKGLKNIFFETDNVQDSKIETPSVVPAPQIIETQSSQQPPVFYGEGIVEQKFLDYFNNELAGINLPSPSYSDFKKKLEATASISASVNETIRYQMVFGMMVGDGLTKPLLEETAQQYLVFLEEKYKEFLATIDSKREEEIGSREKQLADLKNLNELKIIKINELTQEIQENQTKASTIQGEIAIATSKLDQNHKNFDTTYQTVLKSISDDILKIKTNII